MAGAVVAEAVCCDSGVVDDLAASWREISRRQAVMLGMMVAVAEATPVAEFAPMEIAAALALTRQAAAVQLDLAMDIVRRLPDVHAALARGDLDLPRARVICDEVAVLELGLARGVTAVILPAASLLTTGRLRARLAKLVIAADPAAAVSRHRARVRRRRMVVQPTEDSCANVLGLDVPADAAMAAADRVAAIARAVKQAGDPRSLDQIRADTFLDLLLGHPTADPARPRGGVELVADLQTLAGLADHPGQLHGYGPVIADIARQVAEQQRHTPWHFTVYDDACGELYTGTTRARPTEPTSTGADAEDRNTKRAYPKQAHTKRAYTKRGSTGSGSAERGSTGSGSAERGGTGSGSAERGGTGSGSAERGGTGSGSAERGSAGSGYASSGSAERGRTRRGNARPGSAERGRTRHGNARPGSAERGRAAMLGVFGDPARRCPNAALARHVRARDRTCRAPGCRRPATQTDLDHTIAYERGGLTTAGNLGALCRFHHRAKHEGGWRLYQIKPGIFLWQSPLGRLYLITPEPP